MKTIKTRASSGYPNYLWVNRLLITLIFWLPFNAQAIPSEGHQLMISSSSPHALEVGQDIALKGGNVVDVSVAIALTLAVTQPYFASLGGGGFALMKMGKDPVKVLDFREQAPEKTHPTFYLKKAKDASRNGGAAVATPGIPAGLWALHQKYGKLPWSHLFQGPIKLAQKGFRVSGHWVDITERTQSRFSSSGYKYFLKGSKDMYKPGEILKQKALVKALKKMSKKNIVPFYQGDIAKDMVNSVAKMGGVLSLADLKNYKVHWREPLTTNFQGYKIYLMPPPSSGGIVIKSALALIDQLQLSKVEAFSVQELHIMGEILNRSFRGRALLGDPQFYKNPMKQLLSKDYLSKMKKSIHRGKAKKLKPLTKNFVTKESTETTHFSVLDINGNAMAMTLTVNGAYGSALVTDRYGIALNNEMDDFSTRPNEPNQFGLIQGVGNQVEGGKRPLSSMSPTLVEKNGEIVLSLGAPGGPKIISAVLQTLYRTLVTKLNVDQAIQAPRVHHQFQPHKLYLDKGLFTPETIKGLKKYGHSIDYTNIGVSFAVGKTKDGFLEASHDSRSEGASGGF